MRIAKAVLICLVAMMAVVSPIFAADTDAPVPSGLVSVPVTGQPDKLALSIGPSEVVTDPANLSVIIRVANPSPVEEVVTLRIVDYKVSTDGTTTPDINGPVVAPASWYKINLPRFTIPPGSAANITITISPPPDAPKVEQRAVLVAEVTASPAALAGIARSGTQILGIGQLFVGLRHEPTATGKNALEWGVSLPPICIGPPTLTLSFNNLGTADVHLDGASAPRISVSGLGTSESFTGPDIDIPAGSSVEVSVALPDAAIGAYSVNVVLPGRGNDTRSAGAIAGNPIWVFVLLMIAGAGIGLALRRRRMRIMAPVPTTQKGHRVPSVGAKKPAPVHPQKRVH